MRRRARASAVAGSRARLCRRAVAPKRLVAPAPPVPAVSTRLAAGRRPPAGHRRPLLPRVPQRPHPDRRPDPGRRERRGRGRAGAGPREGVAEAAGGRDAAGRAPRPRTPAPGPSSSRGSRPVSTGRRPERPDPGSPAIQRLNRAEYRNAVRDLLGLDLDHARDLPADDSGLRFRQHRRRADGVAAAHREVRRRGAAGQPARGGHGDRAPGRRALPSRGAGGGRGHRRAAAQRTRRHPVPPLLSLRCRLHD